MKIIPEIEIAKKCGEFAFNQVFFKEKLSFNPGRMIDWLLNQYGDEHAADILYGIRRYYDNQAQFDYEAIQGGE